MVLRGAVAEQLYLQTYKVPPADLRPEPLATATMVRGCTGSLCRSGLCCRALRRCAAQCARRVVAAAWRARGAGAERLCAHHVDFTGGQLHGALAEGCSSFRWRAGGRADDAWVVHRPACDSGGCRDAGGHRHLPAAHAQTVMGRAIAPPPIASGAEPSPGGRFVHDTPGSADERRAARHLNATLVACLVATSVSEPMIWPASVRRLLWRWWWPTRQVRRASAALVSQRGSAEERPMRLTIPTGRGAGIRRLRDGGRARGSPRAGPRGARQCCRASGGRCASPVIAPCMTHDKIVRLKADDLRSLLAEPVYHATAR